MRKKADLPSKLCVQCGRPFSWRKKWEKVWSEVRYCSDRCRQREKRNDQVIQPSMIFRRLTLKEKFDLRIGETQVINRRQADVVISFKY